MRRLVANGWAVIVGIGVLRQGGLLLCSLRCTVAGRCAVALGTGLLWARGELDSKAMGLCGRLATSACNAR